MFYSDALSSRNSPLAKVWLAAHVERKLSKTQFLRTSIPISVKTIITSSESGPMSIRLGAQFLIGIARIYSRKAKYLEDDCNDALVRLKLSFQTGTSNVDLSREEETTERRPTMLELDLGNILGLTTSNAAPRRGANRLTTVSAGDISLPNLEVEFSADNSFDLASEIIGTNQFETSGIDVCLNLNLAPEPAANNSSPRNRGDKRDFDEMSVELGRDATGDISRLATPSFDDFGDFGAMDVDIEGPGAFEMSAADITADGIAQPHEPVGGNTPMNDLAIIAQANKKRRLRKQIVDTVTELESGPQNQRQLRAGPRRGPHSMDIDTSGMNKQEELLPNSKVYMILMDVEQHAIQLLYSQLGKDGNSISVAPASIGEPLKDLFNFPSRSKIREIDMAHRQSNESNEDRSVELGRRESFLSTATLNADQQDEGAMNLSHPMPMFDDIGDASGAPENAWHPDSGEPNPFEVNVNNANKNSSAPQTPRKTPRRSQLTPRTSTLRRQGTFEDIEELTPIKSLSGSKLAAFDDPSGRDVTGTLSQTQSQVLRSGSSFASDNSSSQSNGLGAKVGPNTVKALNVLNEEKQSVAIENPIADDCTMSFNQISQKASRRAASSFFYELLLLGSRNCVKLEQGVEPGSDDIHIISKPGLDEAISRYVEI